MSSVLPKVEDQLLLGEFDFDFRRRFAEIIIQIGSMTKAKGMFLEVFVAPQVPRFLSANPQVIEEIVCSLAIHLLGNMDEGGLSIEVDSVAYRDTGDHMLQVTITATGAGQAAMKYHRLHLLGKKGPSFFCGPFDAAMDLTRRIGGEIAMKKINGQSMSYIFRGQFKEGSGPAAMIDH